MLGFDSYNKNVTLNPHTLNKKHLDPLDIPVFTEEVSDSIKLLRLIDSNRAWASLNLLEPTLEDHPIQDMLTLIFADNPLKVSSRYQKLKVDKKT